MGGDNKDFLPLEDVLVLERGSSGGKARSVARGRVYGATMRNLHGKPFPPGDYRLVQIDSLTSACSATAADYIMDECVGGAYGGSLRAKFEEEPHGFNAMIASRPISRSRTFSLCR